MSKIICKICSHYCTLKEGQIGFCGVNKNVDGKLVCLVYGYPNAIQIDPIEKKPLYNFLPHTNTFSIGTVGCNFRCPFCQNYTLSQTSNYQKKEYFEPEKIISLALYYKCKSISYTYNEPTIFYPYIKDIAKLAHKKGLKNIMVSNGFMSKEVTKEIPNYIDAVNLDIKCFNKEYYKKNLKGDLDIILENAANLKKSGLHLEITTLVIPNINDLYEEIQNIAKFIKSNLGTDTPWHLSAFHPDYKMLSTPNTPVKSLKKAYKIAKEVGLDNVYLGNI